VKIGVDAREIQNGVITGIGRSLSNFIRYFCKNENNHTLVLFSEKKLGLKSCGNLEQVLIDQCPTFFWDQLKLPKVLRTRGINLFYSPYYKLPIATKIPVVSQILDLMYLGFSAYKRSLGISRRLYLTVFGKAFAKKSKSIITDSEHAKKDIIKFLKINPNKIVVIPLGLADRYKPVKDLYVLNETKRKFNLPEKYILYLGNFKPHKNVKSLIKAFNKIEKKNHDYKLVLAGSMDKQGRKIKSFASNLGLSKKIVFTDTIREDDNPEALFSLADLFVFPTLYEGFGLPPLEAMACGTPVVASNSTSVPEVVGDAGILVDPLDINGLSKEITDLLENTEKREIYVKRGLERAKCFREKDTAGKLFNHIISLLEKI
jgi:glycosyltransferase involved in cell wall biosynthesis